MDLKQLEESKIFLLKAEGSKFNKYIHSTVCPTTGSQPLPKRVLHRVLSSAFSFENPLLSLRSSSSCLRLLPRLPVTSISFTLSFNKALYKAVPTQNVTNPVSIPPSYFVCKIFLSSLTLRNISSFFHVIDPNDLLHPSSTTHFIFFQVFLTYFSKCPNFNTIQS